MIGADPSNRAAAERCRGFLTKCKELGIKVNKRLVIEENARTTSAGYTAMTKLLSGKIYPDGLFLLYDTAAAGVLQAIREHGIRVPDEMEIVAYGDTVVLHYLSPTITSLRVSTSVLMESMIDILIIKARKQMRRQSEKNHSLFTGRAVRNLTIRHQSRGEGPIPCRLE